MYDRWDIGCIIFMIYKNKCENVQKKHQHFHRFTHTERCRNFSFLLTGNLLAKGLARELLNKTELMKNFVFKEETSSTTMQFENKLNVRLFQIQTIYISIT